MRLVLTGGGTGGHVIPNMAVIEELERQSVIPRERGISMLYIGSKNGPEKNMIEKIGIPYKGIHSGKLRRYFSLENFADLFRIPVGVLQARKILKNFQADKVFSKGGFVSFPVVVAARMLKIPVIIHESDMTPGLANRMCFRFAYKICLSFEETEAYLKPRDRKKSVYTGTPVRSSILNGKAIRTGKPLVLIMGGSQGAEQINDLVRNNSDELLKNFFIAHIVGKGRIININKKGYKQYEYLDEELKNVYASCEIAVSRAGANSLAEIAMLKKKAVIIPLSEKVSRGDQIQNARWYAEKFGWTVLEGKVSGEDFVEAIESCEVKEAGFLNGTEKIVKLILEK